MAISASNVVTFPAPIVASGAEVCSFFGCGNPARARSLCEGHNRQRRAGKELRPLRRWRPVNTTLECVFPGCARRRAVSELCSGHNWQEKSGQLLRPLREQNLPLCRRCKDQSKPKTPEFFAFIDGERSRLHPVCKTCRNMERKQPEKRAREHELHIKREYGVSLEWYRGRLVEQDGRCAICGSCDPGGKGKFCVDHDHETGAVRGLLCNRCNSTIGYARDSVIALEGAIRYLREHGK